MLNLLPTFEKKGWTSVKRCEYLANNQGDEF